MTMAKPINFNSVGLPNLINVLRNCIDLYGHMVIEIDHHGECGYVSVVYFGEFAEKSGGFLLVEGGV